MKGFRKNVLHIANIHIRFILMPENLMREFYKILKIYISFKK